MSTEKRSRASVGAGGLARLRAQRFLRLNAEEVDKVDRKTEPEAVKRDWSWLPMAMPGVAKLMAEKRKAHGAAWVSECWKQGVTLGRPGHFWAAEGPLTIGTPLDADVMVKFYALQAKYPQAVVVDLAKPPAAAGAGHVA